MNIFKHRFWSIKSWIALTSYEHLQSNFGFFPLQMSGSTMLNLSLLTSDMWAVVIRIFAYHEKVGIFNNISISKNEIKFKSKFDRFSDTS